MTKLEKVLYSLARCTCELSDACVDCAYHESAPVCWHSLKLDALELLKKAGCFAEEGDQYFPCGRKVNGDDEV